MFMVRVNMQCSISVTAFEQFYTALLSVQSFNVGMGLEGCALWDVI